MNKNIEKLYTLSGKPRRLIIGLMSGTSLDGLDVALCVVSGAGTRMQLNLQAFRTVPYTPAFKEEITGIFSTRLADLEQVCIMNEWIARQHAGMILECLQQWGVSPEEIDLIASHGQTIFHAPRILHGKTHFPNATLQIGDGDHIAVLTGIITVSDFRQKHIAAGGEGAPLAAYGDYLLFSQQGENRIMLNIGGIANFTFLPGTLEGEKVFSTDTGPGNTMMDAFIRKHYPGSYFDEDAALAGKGSVNSRLLEKLLDHPFFEKPFPKTTGPELFNLSYLEEAQRQSGTAELSHADIMATLNMFSAVTIADAIQKATGQNTDFHFFVSGGGMHNPLLLKNIQNHLPGSVFRTTEDLNVHPDAKEAVLFAILANETVAGGDTGFGNATTGMPSVSMGKISFPS